MGDFGPSYMRAPPPIYACDDCGAQLPLAPGDGSCRFCGGTLRPARGLPDAPSLPNDSSAAEATLEGISTQVLRQIISTSRLDDLVLPHSKPADESAVAELPLVKIEPHIQICVTHSRTVSREVLAAAAERRRKAAAGGADGSDAPAASEPAGAVVPATLEFRGTGSTFGKLLADLEHGVSAPLVIASPVDGASELQNREALAGAIALMWRGGCSFVDKVRRAQKAGALACVVVQTMAKWPFSMSDTSNAGDDIETPSAMICAQDGEVLRRAIEGGELLHAHLIARDHHTCCAVCLQEMIAEELAVRLPCDHTFHEECVRQWLRNQHTCPTCRSALPARDETHRRPDGAPLLPTWADYPLPRGDRTQPSTAMYS
ncbi:hypothetical protein AB1Y20_015417 [Prymnesium parvum]|uniref:RING-type domain-containing protein n=1 Tax=Prymnesium parvum TaxID=97485 RepID=A0AB34K1C9_PRYPA